MNSSTHAACPFSHSSLRGLPLLLGLSVALSVCAAPPAGPDGRRRLLFDDYYQRDRTGKHFSQGVAFEAADRELAPTYSPYSNANSNGFFALAHLLADKFRVETSDRPIDEELLRSTDAYALVCPVKPAAGGRRGLTERDAGLLQEFVARGGMLVLIVNSLTAADTSSFDYVGVNHIARRFGFEFLTVESSTLSVPVAADHPVFDGVDAVIYGSGTTLRLLPGSSAEVLLADPRENGTKAPFGIIARHERGKVLAFGDAGTFGNAHIFRSDVKQGRALVQMFHGLLPDGPLPTYGWKTGIRLHVKVRHEQMIGAYEFENRMMALPRPRDSVRLEAQARALDLASAPDKATAAARMGYTSVVSTKEAAFGFEIGAFDGRAYQARWQSPSGAGLGVRLLPTGRMLEPSSEQPDAFGDWQWALLNELVCAPLASYALPGEKWGADSLTPIPHAQLAPAPTLVPANSTYRFEGESTWNGRSCYLFSRTTSVDGSDWRFQDFVHARDLPSFGPQNIRLLSRGQMAHNRYWIDRITHLPVHTESRISSSIWWIDTLYPDRYEGSHDWRTFENRKEVNFIADFGRLITADFTIE